MFTGGLYFEITLREVDPQQLYRRVKINNVVNPRVIYWYAIASYAQVE